MYIYSDKDVIESQRDVCRVFRGEYRVLNVNI